MAFWAYLLRCADGSYYAGHTDHLEHRIGAHQSGQLAGYTSTRRPVTLVWCQDFPSRIEALEAERRIKGWSRAKKEALIAGDWDRLSLLARNRQDVRCPSTGSGRTVDGVNGQALPIRPEPVEEPIEPKERQ
jgi:predicted GIY-YIG superfamily endonuclease